jgi:HPt (histidine-containing phosphotransfer) domain-containing protein
VENSARVAPTVPFQDWETITKQYAKPALLKMVLESFIKHHLQTPAELRTLMANQEFAVLGKLAHKLKGSACVMTAPKIIKLSEAVETQVTSTGMADEAITESLASAMDLWVAEISSKLATL